MLMPQAPSSSESRVEGARAYVKPILVAVELKAEEVLAVGCKTVAQGSGWMNHTGQPYCGLTGTHCVDEGS
jgi:hypothetical protein